MELKEGMYVRTKYGIAKIKEMEIKEDNEDTCYYLDKEILLSDEYLSHCLYNYEYYLKQIIGEPSYNPIDLIEEGDIIQWEIIEPYRDGGINEVISRFDEGLGIYQIEADRLLSLKYMTIKSIVTHEQFDAMKYEVK